MSNTSGVNNNNAQAQVTVEQAVRQIGTKEVERFSLGKVREALQKAAQARKNDEEKVV